MKILAKTGSGYLVEATVYELAAAAGYRDITKTPGIRCLNQYERDWGFSIGTEIKPSEALKYLNELRDKETRVKDASAVLRGLADMMSMAVPETIVPIVEPEAQS